jgi:hypothetical protein
VPADEQSRVPGVRLAVGGSSHPGKRWRHVWRVSGLHGPSGTATMALVEVGRSFGPLDLDLLAEQAFYRYVDLPWRSATHLGAQVGVRPAKPLRISLTGQLDLGRGPVPEGQLLVVATLRLHRGATRGPLPDRDRFQSPYSPYRWQRADLPRSPGTVPGADPFPSIPQGAEDDDEE